MKDPLAAPVAGALASAFLARGPWTRRGLVARGEAAVRQKPTWMKVVVESVLGRFPRPPRHQFHALARFIESLAVLSLRKNAAPLSLGRTLVAELAMGPRPWDVPSIATTGELADWLELSPSESEWFADARGLERLDRNEPLRHYRYRWVPKRRGGFRLLEAPKSRTKAIQRRVLSEILDRVPPHAAAHGFRRGHSTRTHASHHIGKAVVIRIDLQDFFLSVSAARVSAVFRAAGYPDSVAWALALLCTNVAPSARGSVVLDRHAPLAEVAALRRAEMLARTRHLPQGAPTSPALANLCAYGMDVRLSALSSELELTYTRYADDLVFSGDRELARRAPRLEALVAAIVRDEGFVVNHRKTRVMRAGVRQLVTGVVVNARMNPARDAYDRLKATLHNCATRGPRPEDVQGHPDFRAHLAGRIAHVASLNPTRGQRLARMFERIAWA
ncbi:MAG: Retron-type RNA-directed polymerase [Labilithrix sp.]|nr:Retron-type RNA-directed polymerase [Labilithrix sp.]